MKVKGRTIIVFNLQRLKALLNDSIKIPLTTSDREMSTILSRVAQHSSIYSVCTMSFLLMDNAQVLRTHAIKIEELPTKHQMLS